jgi:hypothetical protein
LGHYDVDLNAVGRKQPPRARHRERRINIKNIYAQAIGHDNLILSFPREQRLKGKETFSLTFNSPPNFTSHDWE